jgi:HD superfamily phosphodiesterase
MDNNEYQQFLDETKIREFVETTCRGRDKSHGVEHMETVANNLREMLKIEQLEKPGDVRIALISAWVHDVCDHKYDHDGSLADKTADYLKSILSDEETNLVINIIARVSYSREVRHGDADWLDTLGENGIRIRNLVSDSDKLEAIGKVGLLRCAFYTSESKHGQITNDELVTEIRVHADEKLLLLKDKYIRTIAGKTMAIQPHNIMLDILSNDEKMLNIVDTMGSIFA